jgi:hypothetical protein
MSETTLLRPAAALGALAVGAVAESRVLARP